MRTRTHRSCAHVVDLRLATDRARGTTATLSPNHLFVETAARPRYGEQVEVTLPSVTPMGALTVQATVRWTTEDGIGIQLDRPGPKAVWALHRMMRSPRANRV